MPAQAVVEDRRARCGELRRATVLEPIADASWEELLTRTQRGDVARSTANVATILAHHPSWAGVLGYDQREEVVVFRMRPPFDAGYRGQDERIPRLFVDDDDVRISVWMAREFDVGVAPHFIAPAVTQVAQQNGFDVVRDYLDALVWDDTPRLDDWLSRALGVEPTVFSCTVGAKWMISAVARVYAPGCQVDHMLILEGEQGLRKSTAMRALVPDERLFSDNVPPVGTKDAKEALRGTWIVEFAELEAIRKTESATMKSFITTRVDRYRAPYGRRTIPHPRRCVFVGTTNEDTYLQDSTGNRRYWPVRCSKVDVDWIETSRDQLWAEAKARYEAGEPWHLDEELERLAAEEQEARLFVDPWRDTIAAYVEKPGRSATGVVVSSVLRHLIPEKGRWGQREQNRVARCLKSLGWEKRQVRVGKGRVWTYFPGLGA